MRAKKFENLTYLKTLAARRKQNYGTKRLLREVKELETNPIPYVGIAVKPSKDNVYKWKCLMTGPKGTIYEGLNMRVEIHLPPSYPRDPPTSINVITKASIPHPFIFRNTICLDCFTKKKNQLEGWNSLYTLDSIFQQLQGFLWEGHFQLKDQKKNKKLIKKALKANDEFKFADEKAGWPGLLKEEIKDLEFLNKEDQIELFNKGLKCFHTKLGVNETPLGYGLAVTRLARTGQVKQATPTPDLLSLKAFIKSGIRRSPAGVTFGYWLPAYLGVSQKERTLHLVKRSLSFIMTNNTNRFDPLMAPKVLLKCLFTAIFKIVDQKTTPNIKIIRQIVQYHSLLLLLAREYPEIIEYMDKRVEKFLKNKDLRTKKETPNLGQMLLCTLFSKEYNFKDVIEPYFEEQLDRQVFWILLKIPELEDDTNTDVIDENRVEVTFASQIISYRLTMFYHDYNKVLRSQFKDWPSMLEYLENNRCKLSNEVEDKVLATFKEAMTSVKNYDQYFERIGLPPKNQDELTGMLKQAVKNSKAKKYHGEVDDVIGLPSEKEQIEQYLSTIKNTLTYCTDGKLNELKDSEWKNNCFERWVWMKDFHNADYERKVTPKDVAAQHEERDKSDFIQQSDSGEIYQTVFSKKMNMKKTAQQYYGLRGVQGYNDDFTWKELYLKLDLEDWIFTLNLHEDFKGLYRRLDIAAEHITNLTLYICPSENLKSGYYYLCSVIAACTNLKVLRLKTKNFKVTIPPKAIINLKKGFCKLNKDGASKIEKLAVDGCQFNNQSASAEAIIESFESLPKLVSLDLNSTNLLSLKSHKLANIIIVSHPNIKELRIIGAANNDNIAKSIADGLMRAKKLEFLEFRSNSCSTGITNLLYNLAFSPKLAVLDLSNQYIGNQTIFVENLQKLISISGSIEYLSLQHLNVFQNFNKEIFKSIGENNSLKYLDLSNNHCSSVNACRVKQLAHAIAINAKKKGSLNELFLGNTLTHSGDYTNFVDNLWTSPYFEENWYGDSFKANKMVSTKRNYDYICNLETLDLEGSRIPNCSFSYDKYVSKINRNLPTWLLLFVICKKLTKLNLKKSHLRAVHMESLRALFTQGYYYSTYNLEKKVQVKLTQLTISKNYFKKKGAKHFKEVMKVMPELEILQIDHCKLGVAGAIAINEALAETTSIKILNMASNNIEVDGARNLGEALKKNTSIKFIDVGFCKIRDEGLRVIGESLGENTNSKLKCLGIRHNFLSDKAFEILFENLSKNKANKLNCILFRGNAHTDYHLNTHIATSLAYSPDLFVDTNSKAYFLEEERLSRTLWVENKTAFSNVISFFKTQEVGIIVNGRTRTGKKYPTVQTLSSFYVLEFAHPLSVEKALILVSKKKNHISGKTSKFYKAGSSTFYYNKDCRSSKYMTEK